MSDDFSAGGFSGGGAGYSGGGSFHGGGGGSPGGGSYNGVVTEVLGGYYGVTGGESGGGGVDYSSGYGGTQIYHHEHYYDPGGAYVGPAYVYDDYHVHGHRGWRGGGRSRIGKTVACWVGVVCVIIMIAMIVYILWWAASMDRSKTKTKQCVECLYDEPKCYSPPCYCAQGCNKYEYI